MCGRFTISLEPAFFQQEFALGQIPSEWHPRYNVSPTQPIPVVLEGTSRNVSMLYWGLIPHWAKDDEAARQRVINARSETLQEKPLFRSAFHQRRCLILADGFYEWQKSSAKGVPKAPFRFTLVDGKPFAFAGLWESRLSPTKEEIRSCVILTCQPNDLVRQYHNRMPVILDSGTCWGWLHDQPADELASLLQPYPAEKMTAYPVGLWVNNPHYDDPQCIQPLNA